MLLALEGVEVLVQAAATYSYRRDAAARMLRDNPAIAEVVLASARDAGTPMSSTSAARWSSARTRTDPMPASSASTPRSGMPGSRSGAIRISRARCSQTRSWLAIGPKGAAVSTVHPSLIIGPGDRGPGQSAAVILALLADPSIYLDAGSGWVDVRDVADAVLALAARPPGERVIVSGSDARYRQVAAELDRLTGRQVRRIWLPPRMVTASARVNDRLGGRLMPSLPRYASLTWPLAVGPIDGSSGERLLGRPYRPLAETLADTLRWWADHGTIPRASIGRLAA